MTLTLQNKNRTTVNKNRSKDRKFDVNPLIRFDCACVLFLEGPSRRRLGYRKNIKLPQDRGGRQPSFSKRQTLANAAPSPIAEGFISPHTALAASIGVLHVALGVKDRGVFVPERRVCEIKNQVSDPLSPKLPPKNTANPQLCIA